MTEVFFPDIQNPAEKGGGHDGCSRGVFASSQKAGSDFGERPRHCRQKHAGWVRGSIPERLGERDGSAAGIDPKNQKHLNLKGEHYGQYFF
jgi:hypothetical protein